MRGDRGEKRRRRILAFVEGSGHRGSTEEEEFCSLEEGRERKWMARGRTWSGRGLEEDEFYCDTWTVVTLANSQG